MILTTADEDADDARNDDEGGLQQSARVRLILGGLTRRSSVKIETTRRG